MNFFMWSYNRILCCKINPILNLVLVLIDTHCHLDIIESFGISRNEVFYNCKNHQVIGMIQIATDVRSSMWNIQLIQEYYQNSEFSETLKVFYTIGLHPESLKETKEISKILSLIKERQSDPYFVGIGETGLDFYQSPETKEQQIESFYEHLKIAKELNLPLIIHCRDDKQYNENKNDAINLISSIGKEMNYEKVIMHCYTYSYKEAKPLINLGWYISFSGILTFKNATFIQETALKIPLNQILIETDAPFLTPVPNRGKINQPAFVRFVFNFLTNLIKVEEEKLLTQLKENTLKIFQKMRLQNL